MRNGLMLVCSMVFVVLTTVSCGADKQVTELNDTKQKHSYSLGMDIAKNYFQRQNLDIDVNAFAQGIKDVLAGGKTLLTDKEAQEVMSVQRREQAEKQRVEAAKKAEGNKKKGQEFLEKNKKEKGVVVLPSGLQYKVIKKGTGAKPKPSDTVECHYKGTLLDGTEFDSSYKRGKTASFPVTGVIKGWTEALQLMKVGAKWQLFIPAELGYGDRGAGAKIGPGATLIFEIELVGIK